MRRDLAIAAVVGQICLSGYSQESANKPDMTWLPQRKTREQISPEEWAGMKRLSERYPAPAKAPGVTGTGKNYYARYSGGLSRPEQWSDVTPAHLAKSGDHHLALLCDMPRLYFTDPTPEGREQAKAFFLKQARLTLATEDQNSGSGRTYQMGFVNFEQNMLAMKDVLKQAGIYDDFARVWSIHKRFMLQEHPRENMDWSRDRITLAWALTANMDDGPEKLYRLRLLQRATSLSYALLFTPDGGGLHHNCDHISYASYSFGEICGVAIKAHGTPFQLSDTAYRNLRTYAWAHALCTVGNAFPGNLCARATLTPMPLSTEQWLRSLADMTQPIDPELASLYLATFGGISNTTIQATVQRYRAAGIKASGMNAHLSYNISAAAIHRRGNWLVSIDGCREPIKGIEMYTVPGSARSFMPNSAFGSIQILTATPEGDPGRGYTTRGWDFNHYAGVTAPVLPYELLMTNLRNGQVRNESRFAGGTSLDENGIWGMIVAQHGHELCRKSAFCFDNRVTVLTSDIHPLRQGFDIEPKRGSTNAPTREPSTFPMHTTLYQFELSSTQEPIEIDGQRVTAFPYQQQLGLDKPCRLMDNKGNGYYLHACQGSVLRIGRKTQYSFDFFEGLRADTPETIKTLRAENMQRAAIKKVLEYCTPIPGDFAMAAIEHDKGAANATPAFTIFVQGAPARGPLPYEILRQDRVAHIVTDHPSKTTGYIVFEPNQPLSAGPLLNVSRPSTIMLQRLDDTTLNCSVSSTDYESDRILTQGATAADATYKAGPVVLALEGTWSLVTSGRKDITCTPKPGMTLITIPYHDYMPVRFTLHGITQ